MTPSEYCDTLKIYKKMRKDIKEIYKKIKLHRDTIKPKKEIIKINVRSDFNLNFD